MRENENSSSSGSNSNYFVGSMFVKDEGVSVRELIQNLKGPLPYRLTNDYFFRIVFQMNNRALKGLVSSLMRMSENVITSVRIENPIEAGKKLEDKEVVLDIKLTVNNNTIMNIEMQVAKQLFWTERSLVYLCRNFDNVNKGEDYDKVKPTHHYAFLNFNLFPECQEFVSTYRFMNVKNLQIYSDKLSINVVNLKHIELATEEDKMYNIDRWARLLTADTWEAVKEAAGDDPALVSTLETMAAVLGDEELLQRLEAREEYERMQRSIKSRMSRLEEAEAKARAKAEEAEAKAEEAEAKAEEAEAKAEEMESKYESTVIMLDEKDAEIERLRAELAKALRK